MSNDRMFQTDIFDRYSNMPLFWSLEPLDFGHCFEFRASNFEFIQAPYGGVAAGTGTQAAKPSVEPVASLVSFLKHFRVKIARKLFQSVHHPRSETVY
jgi:hypothetical protein